MSRRIAPPPTYKVRRATALIDRRDRVQWLRKKGKTPAALELATKLEACAPGTRCGSGACPTCMTLAQARLARGLKERIDETSTKKETIFTLTLVTENEAAVPGDLKHYDPVNHRRRVKRLLSPMPITWAAGGLDLSFNEHREGRYPAMWSPHVYMIGATAELANMRKQLRAALPKSETVPRPVRLSAWKGQPNSLLYTLKAHFDRRIGQDEQPRNVRATGMSRTCRATAKDRIRSAERLELMLFLDDLGTLGRLHAFRCQIHPGARRYTIRLLP